MNLKKQKISNWLSKKLARLKKGIRSIIIRDEELKIKI
jgi:hypothetical protein